MFIQLLKKVYIFCFVILASCTSKSNWYKDYDKLQTNNPTNISSFTNDINLLYTNTPKSEKINIAVLLPLSGKNANIGKGIKNSIEIAFLQNPNNNVSVNFYDLTGDESEKKNIILTALSIDPSVIIGPIFAEDSLMLQNLKPIDTPVISFSSDVRALGGGILSIALIPTQNIETIIKEMKNDGTNNFVVISPDNTTDKIMAGIVEQTASVYDLSISGIYYYKEKDSESIKEIAKKVAMFEKRQEANDTAKSILSDILIKENLSFNNKDLLNNQLEKLKKSDTLGNLSYDSILFLGNANDSKNLISFLRYFDVSQKQVRFYGTTKWNPEDIKKETSMQGAKFVSIPKINTYFTQKYNDIYSKNPNILDAFAFDAGMLTINAIKNNKNITAYLLNPSGYNGTAGLFRLNPSGESERALEISAIYGDNIKIIKSAPSDFLNQIYYIKQRNLSPASEKDIDEYDINVMNYLEIPNYLKSKYKAKKINYKKEYKPDTNNATTILPDYEIIKAEEGFQSITKENINKKDIDNIEIYE